MNYTPRRQRGFTVIELIIVIVIIGIIAAVSVVAYNGVRVKALDAQKAAMLDHVEKSLESYYTIYKQYPATDKVSTVEDVKVLGLKREDVEPDGFTGTGLEVGTVDASAKGLRYTAAINADGSGGNCTAPTPCRYYTTGYWSVTENKAVVVSNGR